MSQRWLDTTGQRWKARFAYCALSLQIALLAWLFIRKDRAWALIVFCLHALVLLLAIAGIVSVRCRVCGELVLWWALKNSRNPVATLDQLKACPNCGATTNDELLWGAQSEAPTQSNSRGPDLE